MMGVKLITMDAKVGDTFASKPKSYAWERLWAFSGGRFRLEGWPTKNIHTDLPFAKASGLPKVAASATQYEGHMAAMMVDLFGADWLKSGWLDLKFINLVDAGDMITFKAVVQSKTTKGGTTEFVFDSFGENQRGEKIMVGLTKGYLGKITQNADDAYFKRIAELKADKSLGLKVVPRPGPVLTPLEYLPTKELNEQFCYAEEDFDSRYTEGVGGMPPIVHPGLLFNWSNVTRSPAFQRGGWGNEGGVHTQDEAFMYNPAFVGKKIIVNWPADFYGEYEKRGRKYTMGHSIIKDEDGRTILRRIDRSTVASSANQAYEKKG